MKDDLLFFVTDSVDPYINLAMEQCLMESDLPNPVLFIWQCSDTIVIGHNQDLENECKAESFLAQGGKIARRRSGGGAVYQDLGNVNVSLIDNISGNGDNKQKLEAVLKETLFALGVQSCVGQRNDILIEGKKISGSAEYIRKGKTCSHATVLIDTDINRMTSFLTPGIEKLMKNHVASVSSRVMNLSALTNIEVTGFIETLIRTTGASELKQFDQRRFDEYCVFYSSYDWIWKGLE